MNRMTLELLSSHARDLVTRLLEDVEKAKTREEHIRITARANEATHILYHLEDLAATETDDGSQI